MSTLKNCNCSQILNNCCCNHQSSRKECLLRNCTCFQNLSHNNSCNCHDHDFNRTLRNYRVKPNLSNTINLADYISKSRKHQSSTQRLDSEGRSKYKLVKKYSSPWHQNKGMREWYVSNVIMKKDKQSKLSKSFEKFNHKKTNRTSRDSNKSSSKENSATNGMKNSTSEFEYTKNTKNNQNLLNNNFQNLSIANEIETEENDIKSIIISINKENEGVHEEHHNSINIRISQADGFNCQEKNKRTAVINLENLFMNHINNKENIEECSRQSEPQVTQRKEFNEWVEEHYIDPTKTNENSSLGIAYFPEQKIEHQYANEEILNSHDHFSNYSNGNYNTLQEEFQANYTDSCPSTKRNYVAESQTISKPSNKNFNSNPKVKVAILNAPLGLKAMNLIHN